MLDEATIRSQISQYRNRLARIDDERNALSDVVKGLESLLKALSDPDYVSTAPAMFPPSSNVPRPLVTKNDAVSMRGAVTKIMAAADEPLHSRQIYDIAVGMGASTNAKAPVSVVDLVLLGLANKGKVKKVAPRTWRRTETEPKGSVG